VSVGEEVDAMTVNEGVALMVAWCRYLGVDDNVTVIPSTDFAAGFKAAQSVSDASDHQYVPKFNEGRATGYCVQCGKRLREHRGGRLRCPTERTTA
jgi:hypothetical protein